VLRRIDLIYSDGHGTGHPQYSPDTGGRERERRGEKGREGGGRESEEERRREKEREGGGRESEEERRRETGGRGRRIRIYHIKYHTPTDTAKQSTTYSICPLTYHSNGCDDTKRLKCPVFHTPWHMAVVVVREGFRHR
jgi:hypothetical protein